MFRNKMWFLLDEEANLKNMCKNAAVEAQKSGFLKIEKNGSIGLKDQNANIQLQNLISEVPLLASKGHADTKVVSVGKENFKIRISACVLFAAQLDTNDEPIEKGCDQDMSHTERNDIALIFSSVGREKVKETELCDHFKLTKQELDLAVALYQGESIADFAQKQQVSKETIRTRLKMLFGKTSTHRQIDIVRVVQSFVY